MPFSSLTYRCLDRAALTVSLFADGALTQRVRKENEALGRELVLAEEAYRSSQTSQTSEEHTREYSKDAPQ